MERRGPRRDQMRRMAGALAAVAVITTLAAVIRPAPAAEALMVSDHHVPVAGPLGPISVIGDSVLLGAGAYSPTLVDHLAAAGFGPIRFRAGVGYSTGANGSRAELSAGYWIRTWRTDGHDAPIVIVNLGANDSGVCRTDLACARRSIEHVLDQIGPGPEVWWPMITHESHRSDWERTWNAALVQLAAERSELTSWDWPAVMRAGSFPSTDNIHLSPGGNRLRSQLIAEEIITTFVRARRTGRTAALPIGTAPPAGFVALPPSRVLDTRREAPGRLRSGQTVTVRLADHLPPGATAVAVNLTAVMPSGVGHLTAYRCDRARREVSSLNYLTGTTRAAMAVLPISPDATLCVYTRQATDLIVDLQGAFRVPAETDGDLGPGGAELTGLVPVEPARRLLDTRTGSRARLLTLRAPAGARAVAVNLTATGAQAEGYVTAYPCEGRRPTVSNLNVHPGEAIANAAYVPVGRDGRFCVFTSVDVDLIVDLTAEFRAGDGLRFVSAGPGRVLDTRSGTGGWSPMHGAGQTLEIRVAPPEARAVTGTLTRVGARAPGHLSAHRCGRVPPTSTVNGPVATATANAATIGVGGSGSLCITSSAVTHSIFDTTGWWIDDP